MFGLPSDIDLTFFQKQRLIQICFGANDLQLHFDEKASVSITSLIRFKSALGDYSETEDYRQLAGVLVTLLDQTVKSARGEKDGTLELVFESGVSLTVFDNTEHYESYMITHGDTQIVV